MLLSCPVLTSELLKQIRKLEITSRKAVSDALAGQYHSVFKGRGMAFSEVRPYQPGDDVRTIDWNVTARLSEPFVKVFNEERELTVMLVLDVSASTAFGSKSRTKMEVAAEVAAQIAFSAIANNDRVGLILFSDRVEKLTPPKKGRKHVLRVISDILTTRPLGQRTVFQAGLDALSHVARRRTVTFLLSDFLAQGHERALRIAARRHDLVPVVLVDPLEETLPDVGLWQWEDPETHERVLVDTSDGRVRNAFMQATAHRRMERLRLFRQLAVDHVELRAGDDYAHALTRFFHLRARRAKS